MPDVTVCVINYNGEVDLPATLQAIAAQHPPAAEIIVVDDASTDESVAVARGVLPTAKVIEIQDNSGPAAARNVGFSAAKHDLILFVDNDVVLGNRCLHELTVALLSHSGAALAMPRVFFAADRHRIQYDGAGCHFTGLMALRNANVLQPHTAQATRPTESIVSACFLADRGRWPDAVFFEEQFFIYFEDHDLGMRARLLGRHVLSVPRASCYHHEGTRGLSLRRHGTYTDFRVRCLIRNRWLILLRLFAGRSLLVLAPVLFLYEGIQCVVVLRRRWHRQWFQAAISVYRNTEAIRRRRQYLQRHRVVHDRQLLEGGAIPFTSQLPDGQLDRAGLALLNRVTALYWSVARRLL